MSMTGTIDRVEVITSVQRRRRWSAEEWLTIATDLTDDSAADAITRATRGKFGRIGSYCCTHRPVTFAVARQPPLAATSSQGLRPGSDLETQEIDQRRDVADVAKIVNDRKACLDLLFGDPRVWHQGPIFRVHIGPGDPTGSCSSWFEYGARAGAAVLCPYRYGGTLPIARDIVGWRVAHPDSIDQLVDYRVGDLLGCSMDPRKVPIGCSGSEKVGRAMRHTDQVRRV